MDSELHSLLSQYRGAVLEGWLEKILATYPVDTARFLRTEKDRFANPVGQTIQRALGALLDGLLRGAAPDELRGPLDEIIRIRAVQDLLPSQALAFVLQLGDVVEEVLGSAAARPRIAAALSELRRDQGALALGAFDVYQACREKVYEVRVNEIKGQTGKLVERMNRIYGKPGEP